MSNYDTNTELWLGVLQTALETGQPPANWPQTEKTQTWQKIIEDLLAIRRFSKQLANGDLSSELRVSGHLAGNLKALQANLRHLTWQARQVAAGDYSQRVEFMGEFSEAFNAMIANLQRAVAELQTSEERYRFIVETSPDDITITDPQGIITFVSPAALNMFGYDTVDELVGKSIFTFLPPEELALAGKNFGMLTNNIRSGITEYHALRKDGRSIAIEVRGQPILAPDGSTEAIMLIIRDITERQRAQIAENEQHLLDQAMRDTAAGLNQALTLEEVFNCVLKNVSRIVSTDTINILMVENGVARIVCHADYRQTASVSDSSLSSLLLPVDTTHNLQRAALSRQPYRIDEIHGAPWVRTASTAWAHSNLVAPILIKDNIAGFLSLLSAAPAFFNDSHAERLMAFANQAAIAIEKVQLIEQLNQLATTDPLTGISNRRNLFAQGERELERARRYQAPLAAVMLDIDHFKQINDAWGHAVGDQVLREVALVCTHSLRQTDIIGRYGGEEFAILLPQLTLTGACRAAERLRQAIANHTFTAGDGALHVTVSLGVAGLSAAELTIHNLLDKADQALYHAKHHGRNRVSLHRPTARDASPEQK